MVIYRVLSPNFPLKSVVIYDELMRDPSLDLARTQTCRDFAYDALGGGGVEHDLSPTRPVERAGTTALVPFRSRRTRANTVRR